MRESSFFSSIALWFGRNNVFSRLSNKWQTQLYRGCFQEDVSVHANICSLGLNGYRVSVAISLNAPNFWWKNHSGLPTCDHLLKLLLNFAQQIVAPIYLPSLVELGLLSLTSSSILRLECAASAWMVRAMSWVTLGLGGLPWLSRAVMAQAPLAASCPGHVCQERGCAAGCGVTVLPQCWSLCCLSQGLNSLSC